MTKINRTAIFLSLTLALLMVMAEVSSAEKALKDPHFGRKRKESIPSVLLHQKSADLIAILPCTSIVVFQTERFLPEISDSGPGGGQAKVTIAARSPLPRWGVCIEPPVIKGPKGLLPPDRIWIRSEATEGTFYSLERAVPVLFGGIQEGFDRQITLEMQLRPSWLDLPGHYQGHIVARPLLPAGNGARLNDESADKRLGREQKILVELEIPETILTSFSETELKFKADAGPGVYPADRDVEFALSTNAPQWRVDYRASDLIGEERDVKTERMSWERLDRLGRVEARGKVGADEAVISGAGPVDHLEVRLRFKIQVTMEDPAGEYGGTISLVGLTD